MKKKIQKPCRRHRWSISSWSTARVASKVKVEFVCRRCNIRTCRALLPKEKSYYLRYIDPISHLLAKYDHVHVVYHEFLKIFQKRTRSGSFKLGNKKISTYDESWRWTGYKLMQKVRAWAKKYPRDVRVSHCDDHWHASSDLVLIEHQTKNNYMGTTVVYIPQCTGENPIQFFLYPGHRSHLIDALTAIRRSSIDVEKKERVESKRIRALEKKTIVLPSPSFQPKPLDSI